ncbi:unnamed protein product [Coccothraustes coccothraustes]
MRRQRRREGRGRVFSANRTSRGCHRKDAIGGTGGRGRTRKRRRRAVMGPAGRADPVGLGPRWGGRRSRCCFGSGEGPLSRRNEPPAPPTCLLVPVEARGSTWSQPSV